MATTTFPGAMPFNGFIAPCTVDGAINGRILLAWVQQLLTPALKPSDLAAMDPASQPPSRRRRKEIAASAELRYLPPYSPDRNLLELAFSKFKKLLQDGAHRTVDRLWELCDRALDEFTANECRNYIQHCDYRYT